MSDRKIPTTSLSEQLRKKRKLLKISVNELSEKTGIPTKYLHRIENGEWNRLPSAVYTKGFLKKYAKLVGANSDRVVSLYNEEVVHQEGKENIVLEEKERTLKGKLKGVLLLSPRTFRIIIALVVLIIVLVYIGYQLRGVLASPKIFIDFPAEEEIITTGDNIKISGRSEQGVDLFLNNKVITTQADGSFQKTLELLPGLNVFEIKAVSRFNRETIIIKRVIYNLE